MAVRKEIMYAKHEGYAKAFRSFANRYGKKEIALQPRLLEAIPYKDNFLTELQERVKANKGAPELMATTIEEALPHLANYINKS